MNSGQQRTGDACTASSRWMPAEFVTTTTNVCWNCAVASVRSPSISGMNWPALAPLADGELPGGGGAAAVQTPPPLRAPSAGAALWRDGFGDALGGLGRWRPSARHPQARWPATGQPTAVFGVRHGFRDSVAGSLIGSTSTKGTGVLPCCPRPLESSASPDWSRPGGEGVPATATTSTSACVVMCRGEPLLPVVAEAAGSMAQATSVPLSLQGPGERSHWYWQ